MSHSSLANSQNVPAGPSTAPPFALPKLVFSIVDVRNASPEALRVIRGIGVPVPENIGWAASPSSSTSSSPSPSDCSSPSSVLSDGGLEPASGPSRRTKQSNDARRKAAGPRARTKTSSEVPRPPNCFILFRQQFTGSKDGQKYLQTVEGKQNNLSRVAGALWRKMTEEEKEPYRLMQQELARQHKLANPDYQFAPSRRGPTKKRVNKNKDSDIAVSELVANLHQTLPTDAVVEASERFKVEFKAKRASTSPTGSPARSISPAGTPKAFADPLYPPGDRTPQPRPAQPRVIELAPAPTFVPSSVPASEPSPSSATHYPAQSTSYYSTQSLQAYSYNATSAPGVQEPSSWSAQATSQPYQNIPAQLSVPEQLFSQPSTYQQDAEFAYQPYSVEQMPSDMSLALDLAPVDAYPLEHTMSAASMDNQQQLPDFNPTLFDNMMTPMPTFGQRFLANTQNVSLDARGTALAPQFYPEQFVTQQQYSTTAPEQQWALPALATPVPDFGDITGFDIDAMKQELDQAQRQYFQDNGQYLHDYSQDTHAQWNA
ncbi:unnamed protein product [Peniophora sp. CBMAI 1063]|nr:unnamed protein product [Peniophora sp. CBMAI 1063]